MTTSYPIDLAGPKRLDLRTHAGLRDYAGGAKWQTTGMFLVLGYVLFNRSFAYLGIPQLKLFIGEIVLGCFLIFRRVEGIDTFFSALATPGHLRDCAWAILLFIGYGLFETCRGIALGYPLLTCFENFAFNYYALYLLLGWWLGWRNPYLLKTIVTRLAWLNGIYGIAFIVFLSRVPVLLPGSQGDAAGIFGQPWGAALSLLGLLCFETHLERVAVPLLLNTFVLLGMQVRAEWIGFLAGLVMFVLLTRQVKRLLIGAGAVCALLAVGFAADISLPGAGSRAGGVISTREIAARAVAPFDQDAALTWTKNARTYEETAAWRTNWWKAIWRSVHQDATHAAIGNGYGYPLVDLVPYLKGRYWLRTPHSIFFYALGYGGWVQVILLLFLEATMAVLLWRAFRITSQPYGLVAWVLINAWVFFDSAFESPFRAIPFFLLTGIAMAPATVAAVRLYERPLRP
ncbi:MAG TPA: hypothetical protein VGL82_02060 [Bryobacteraceae bacterium]|jgi:hypothetical protein